MKPLERDLERKVTAYAKSRDVICYKFTSPANRGVPDRILIGPTGLVGFLELKRPGGLPTSLQMHVLTTLARRGATVAWTDSLDRAKLFIDDLCKPFDYSLL